MDNPSFHIGEDKVPQVNISIIQQRTETETEAKRPSTRALSIAYDPFKSYNQSQKIVSAGLINKQYLRSAQALLRILLAVFQLCALISAACIRNTSHIYGISCNDSQTCSLTDPIQISYLVFIILAFLLSLVMFFSILFNLIYKGSLVRLNWKIIFTIIDLAFAIAIFIISIACAYRASNPILAKTKAALASAAAFGFLVFVVYVTMAFLSFFAQKLEKHRESSS